MAISRMTFSERLDGLGIPKGQTQTRLRARRRAAWIRNTVIFTVAMAAFGVALKITALGVMGRENYTAEVAHVLDTAPYVPQWIASMVHVDPMSLWVLSRFG